MRFGNVLAVILISLMMHSSLSHAAMIINVTESGGDVIASANGTINTAGLTPFGGGTVYGGFTYGSGYNAFYDGVLVVSTLEANRDGYILNSPVVFSTGTSIFTATSNTGSSISITLSNVTGYDRLHVPGNYVSNSQLSASSTWAGTTITALGLIPGTYVITWGSGETADSLTLNIDSSATPADQTITGFTATPPTGIVKGSSTLSATASSGLTVSFGSSTTDVCTVTGTTVNYLAAGPCTVTADQGGNASYNPAPQITLGITVAKADQTITGLAANPAAGVVEGSSALSATASSGLPVSFGSSTSTVCSVTGTTVSFLAAGTCTVTSDQAGDAAYNAATQVTLDITVSKADQTITGLTADPASGEIGGTSTLSVSSGASSMPVTFGSNTLTICTVAGSTVSYLAVGTCTVTADQAGDANYNPAPQVTLDINVIELIPNVPVPTLSLWGLVAMFLMILGIGGVVVRRKTLR